MPPPDEVTLEVTPANAVVLWRSVAESLRASGLADAGPAYRELSNLLIARRLSEGSADPAWGELAEVCTDVLALLAPLSDAGRLLSATPVVDPPADERASAAPGSARRARATNAKPSRAVPGDEPRPAGPPARRRGAGRGRPG